MSPSVRLSLEPEMVAGAGSVELSLEPARVLSLELGRAAGGGAVDLNHSNSSRAENPVQVVVELSLEPFELVPVAALPISLLSTGAG